MNRVSIAMIAHNEADNIGAALASVAWTDQIVVVDCESNDTTAEIAVKAGAEVHREPNHPNLNINKNIAIDHCRGDWILVLDADEIVPYDLAGEIRLAISAAKHNGYAISRRNHVLGKWLKHGGQFPDWQLRLFRARSGRFPAEHIHERLKIDGSVGKLVGALEHHPYPNLTEMMRKGAFYAEFEAQYLWDRGVRISSCGLLIKSVSSPACRFLRRYLFKGGLRDGVPGFAAACFDAWNQSVRWLRLWDLQREHDSGGDRT